MKDIHIWLTDGEAEQLAALAQVEDRSLTNMVRYLVREGLARRTTAHPRRTPAMPVNEKQLRDAGFSGMVGYRDDVALRLLCAFNGRN